VAISAIAISAQKAGDKPVDPDVIEINKESFLVFPEQFVMQGKVTEFVWSEDGEYLLAIREENEPQDLTFVKELKQGGTGAPQIGAVWLTLWSKQTRKCTDLMRLPDREHASFNITCLRGKPVAYVLLSSGALPPKNLLVDFEHKKAIALQPLPEEVFPSRKASPKTPYMIQVLHPAQFPPAASPAGGAQPPKPPRILQSWDANGRKIAETVLPDNVEYGLDYWSKDGKYLILPHKRQRVTETMADGSTKLVNAEVDAKAYPCTALTVPDLRSSAITADLNELFELDRRGSTAGAYQQSHKFKVSGKEHSVQGLWLGNMEKTGVALALLTAGKQIGSASLAPSNTGVAFTRNGDLFVCPMLKIDKDDLAKYLALKGERETTDRAKSVAIAMAMYAADSDDLFPLGGDPSEAVNPYLKDPSILNGFVYTFAGGELPKDKSPADIQLGYITGPGGRAFIYADGHVRWEPKG
jgi:hypothetical protein